MMIACFLSSKDSVLLPVYSIVAKIVLRSAEGLGRRAAASKKQGLQNAQLRECGLTLRDVHSEKGS
jgi:hypothetical protein